jgi:hypothetical protein
VDEHTQGGGLHWKVMLKHDVSGGEVVHLQLLHCADYELTAAAASQRLKQQRLGCHAVLINALRAAKGLKGGYQVGNGFAHVSRRCSNVGGNLL